MYLLCLSLNERIKSKNVLLVFLLVYGDDRFELSDFLSLCKLRVV